MAHRHPEWALGFEDETWWSRLWRPSLHTWSEAGQPMRLVEQVSPPGDTDPPALACYGLLVSCPGDMASLPEQIWLRFADGRPVSGVTTQFLAWCCAKLEAAGKVALLLIWDNAPWHISREVRQWLREHNRQVKEEGKGIRLLSCYLPIKSPWLNPLEPHWMHGKRKVVEPDRLLPAHELAERVCAHFQCPYESHLTIPEIVT